MDDTLATVLDTTLSEIFAGLLLKISRMSSDSQNFNAKSPEWLLENGCHNCLCVRRFRNNRSMLIGLYSVA